LEKKWVYIMLTDTGTWLNKVVKKYTDAPYNHASIGLDENLETLYSFGRKKPKNPFYGGFVKEDVVSGTYRHFPNTKCVLYRLQITDKQYKRIRRIIKKFENRKHKYTFNFIGLMAVMIDKPVKRKSAYFCSQFVAEVLRRSGVYVFDKESALVQPNDLSNVPKLEKLYEGKLYDYDKVLDKFEEPPYMQDIPGYDFFLKSLKKRIHFVNPMFYYHYASDKMSKKEELQKK